MATGNNMKYNSKILVIPSWYPPDGGYFFKEHSEALQAEGLSVDVLVNRVISIRRLGRVRFSQLSKFQDSRENGLRVIRSWIFKIPKNENRNALRWIRSTLKLYEKYQQKYGPPDMILAHSAIWAGCAAHRISKLSNIPYVITEHRSFFVYNTEASRKMLQPFYRPLLREAYAGSKHLVVVSDSMKPGLLDLDPGLESHIREIPNMVDCNFFSLPAGVRSKDPFVFISAGRLIPVKGLDLLIRAFTGLIQNGQERIILKILGRGEQRSELEKLATDLKISEKVIFTGRISRESVRDEFQTANCYILPSRYEAFGVVLIEAMATGLPVIATRSGGPAKIVKPDLGYLVESEDQEGLGQAMHQMIKQYSDFDQPGIRKSVLDRYDQPVIARQYLDLLNE